MARIRTLLAATLVAACFTVLIPAPADAGPRRQMVRTINFVRSWGHIHGLHYSSRLSHRANSWARHLIRTRVLRHSRAQGEVIEFHTGGRPRVRATVSEWLRSPGHRSVMLAHKFHGVGAGRAVGYFNGRRVTIWVVRFAT